MNFLKLIPILFLAHSPVGDARPTGQHVLPAIPGYIPVYIQTGNQPPNLEELYLGPQSKSAEEPAPPKREIPAQIDPVKGEGQGDRPSEDGQKKEDIPKKIEEIKEIKEEDKKDIKEISPIEKIEHPVRLDTKEKVKPVGQIREVPQYEVKEPQQE